MPDAPVVHIGENSPEHVAYNLMIAIAHNESKSLRGLHGNPSTADRSWILSTYAECLMTVRDPFGRSRGTHASKPAAGGGQDPRDELDL